MAEQGSWGQKERRGRWREKLARRAGRTADRSLKQGASRETQSKRGRE
jgi:hypothetical protein